MDYFLGIDAGGTKTAASIITALQNPKSSVQNGTEEIGRGTGGSCSLATGDYPQWTRAVREAARGACQSAGLPEDTRFAAVCAGIAGYSLKAKRAEFAEILAEEISADRYDLTPDYEIAYWGASGGEPGVVVIAGTGAVAFGRSAQGETHKEDGLGYLLGDRGSGYSLGLNMIELVIMALNNETFRTTLTDAVLAAIRAETTEEVVAWLYQDFSPAKVAALAPLIGQMADAGDKWACARVMLNARLLRDSVCQTFLKLDAPLDTPVYPLGGLWKIGLYFCSQFARPTHPDRLSDFLQNQTGQTGLNVCEPLHDAALGAALLARHKAK